MAKPSEIAILLGLKDKDFRTGMQRAKNSLSDFGSTVSGVGASLGVLLPAATLAGMAAFAKSAIDTADHLNDLRLSTGLAVPTLAGLSNAAEKSGTDLATAARAVQKFSQLVLDASNNGGEAAEKLERYGLSVAKLKEQSPEEQLFELARALEQIGDEQRPAVLIDLLGQKMAAAAPLFSEGEAALRELIATGQKLNPVTEEMALQADQFNDSMADLKASTQGLATSLAKDVLPWMNEVAKATAIAAEEGGLLAASWVALGGLGKAIFTDEFINKQRKLVSLRNQLAVQPDQDGVNATYLREQIDLLEKEVKAEQDAAAAKIKADKEESAAKQAKSDADRKRFETAQKQRADEKRGVSEQIADANKLRDALTKAFEDAGKAAKDYFAQADDLRRRAATTAAPEADDVEGQALAMLDLIVAEQKLQRIRAQSPLSEVQKQADLVRDMAARIADQARAKEALKTADLAEADALDRAGNLELERQKGLTEQQKQNDARLTEFSAKLKDLEKGIVIPVRLDTTQADRQIEDLKGTTTSAPGFATGGYINGPGTSQSDSILARLSNGEYVLRAAAVRHYGSEYLHRLNRMALPKFAAGGMVSRLAVPSVPSASVSGPASVVNLTLPGGEQFEMQAQESVARALQRAVGRASIMHGRRK